MDDEHTTSHLMKYIILQTVTIPSILCDLFVFFYLFRHWRKEIVTTPPNHVIFCLLILSFLHKTTDVPFVLYFLRWHSVLIHTHQFCLFWTWLDYSTAGTCLHLLTWCCIERHFFIFHSHRMKMKRTLILLHYIPLTVTLVYLPLFLAVVVFFPTGCVNQWSYNQLFCGGPCFIELSALSAFDWIFHCVVPNVVIILANALLFGRLVWQKVKRNRPVRWKRQRRLVIQLVFISSLFLILFGPMMVVGVIQIHWKRETLADIQEKYFYFLPYFTTQLLPFVIAGQLTGMRREWVNWLHQMKVYGFRRSRIHVSLTTSGRHVTRETLRTIPDRRTI